ncbi:hypothetical protein [Kineosporia babensis]|uniref:Uncharacterized protein n=1 Tax=Kineosporia babensis TaxID=499548 RepID=A0A9X1SXX9_9ACTN|nr:hypothetical protein [Kineosporia babensis]MCD5316466.1 hypothetical protein [Kineosporia babensis]
MYAPDISLVVLFLLTAAYTAVTGSFVAAKRQHGSPVLVGGAAFAGVLAFLFGVLLIANLSVIAALVVSVLASGVGCYRLVRADLTQNQAITVAVGATLLVAAVGLFVLYLALISLIVAGSSYLVVRLWWQARATLVAMGTMLGGLLAASAVVFGIALSQM